MGGRHTKTARGPASEPSWDSACASRSSRGPPGLFNSVECGLAQVLNLRSCSREGGGDEETRTPDLLLAKEMLYQLSYVPLASRELWWAFLDSNQRPLPYQGSALTS
jgi:hypothetical protein